MGWPYQSSSVCIATKPFFVDIYLELVLIILPPSFCHLLFPDSSFASASDSLAAEAAVAADAAGVHDSADDD